MNETLNIPEKLKIGFKERSDTYTGKLSYVTYINKKGELAKEKSWSGWKDKKITPLDIDNVPTEGFVLNKKVGGYSTGWNHRQTYCRVYDPRDFEFEITIENLLYILQECTSTKGKGLEGQFVYAWSGKDLVLLPVTSPDYQASRKLIDSTEKITMKSLKIGASYKSKDSENVIYLGKMIWYYFIYDTQNKYVLKNKTLPTFVDVTEKIFYGINTLSKLYFMINDNEISLSEVEDYKEKFLHTFNGQANSIDKLVLKEQPEKNFLYQDDRFYTIYIDETNGKAYNIETDKIYKYQGKSYYTWKPQRGYWYQKEELSNELPFKNYDEFLKIAEVEYIFKIRNVEYLQNNNTEYYITSTNYDYLENIVILTEDEKQKLIENKDKKYSIYAKMKNGDECKMITDYHNLTYECQFK